MPTTSRAHRLPASMVTIGGLLGLLTVEVVMGGGQVQLAAAALIALVLAVWISRVARSWTALISFMMLVALLMPSDGRYALPSGLPFRLEPCRVVVGLLLVGWIAALLVDPRVRARATKLEAPLLVIIAATLGSEMLNPARVSGASGFVVKALGLFVYFVLLLYMVVSVVRTRPAVERILMVLVCAGCVEALGAVVQERTGFNAFDHLHAIVPIFDFNGSAPLGTLVRAGIIRATASAGHPIELACTMAMLLPLAAYLAISRRQARWGVALVLLLLGEFAGGSRTGIIGVLVVLAVSIWLRPRQSLRCLPALIPALLAIQVASPGGLNRIIDGFFPKGGLIAQQSQSVVVPGRVLPYANRLSRLAPSFQVFLEHNPLLGEGYGTRVTGRGSDVNAMTLDDQWLGTLLEMGLLGVLGWAWLFARLIRRLAALARLERRTEGWLPVALAGSIASFASSMFLYDAFSYIQATFIMFTLIGLASVVLWLAPATSSRPSSQV